MLGVRKGVHHISRSTSKDDVTTEPSVANIVVKGRPGKTWGSKLTLGGLGMANPSQANNDEDVLGRVREGLRAVGVEVQDLIERHQSEVGQLVQQIEHLKTQASTMMTEDTIQLPGLPSHPDSAMIVPCTEPPTIVMPLPARDGNVVQDYVTTTPSQKSDRGDTPETSAKDAKRTYRETFRKKLAAVLDSTKSGKKNDKDGGRISVASNDDRPMQTLLPDAESMKEKVRDAVTRPEYNVADYYHKTGICQAIATNAWFEMVTILIIFCNAVWIAIDIDYNDAALLSNAHPVFQIAEHGFCAFFMAEWTVRFLSFRNKRDCFKDAWFVFDSILAFAFALEAWFLTILAAIVELGSTGVLGNASILRLFRLMRLNRMGRLVHILRAFPEMSIVIKGIGVAVRSVFFTICLLTVMLYVFGIGFRTLSSDTVLESEFFPSVPGAMLSLLLGGILPEYEYTVRKIGGVNLILGLLFGMFMFITTITLMNFLIGVLVEAVSAVAVTEKEQLTAKFVKSHMHDLLEKSGIDQDGNKLLSKSEFEELLLNPHTSWAMQNMGVDVVGLVEFGEMLFQDNDNELAFPDFIRLVLQLRGTNPTTVKDIVDLRKFVMQEISALEETLVEAIHDCIPKQRPSNRTASRRSTIHRNALDKMLAT